MKLPGRTSRTAAVFRLEEVCIVLARYDYGTTTHCHNGPHNPLLVCLNSKFPNDQAPLISRILRMLIDISVRSRFCQSSQQVLQLI